MSTEVGLRATVCERPHDDLPRLVYADWLDESGLPADAARAEFIRVQCRLAGLDRYDPERRALRKLEQELFKQFGRAWVKIDKLTPWVSTEMLDAPMFSGRFRRGFIDTIRFRTPAQFLSAAKSVFDRTPLTGMILKSAFSDPGNESQAEQAYWGTREGYRTEPNPVPESHPFPAVPDFVALLESPWIARLRFIELGDHFSPPHLVALLAAESIRQLQHLSLAAWNCYVVGHAWEPLAGSDTFRALKSLNLQGCELHEPGLRALVRAKFPQLERLVLGGGNRWELEPEWIRVLTTATNLPVLKTLIFGGARGGANGLRALAKWPTLRNLQHLDLTHNHTDHETERDYAGALAEFAVSPNWVELRELNLDGDSVPYVQALEGLTKSPRLQTLRRLTIDMSFEGMEAARAQNRVAKALTESALSAGCELHFYCEYELSDKATRLLSERFGDRLTLYSGDRQTREYR